MSVHSIMSSPVTSVAMDDSLQQVMDIFHDTGFHHLLVVEKSKLIGIISDRDLLRALSPRIGTPAETQADAAILNKKAHQIMTRRPICLDPQASIYDAIDIFDHHPISCIPIVEEDHTPVGIVSWRDIFKAIKKHRPENS